MGKGTTAAMNGYSECSDGLEERASQLECAHPLFQTHVVCCLEQENTELLKHSRQATNT
jgi:hypothetical protein